MAKSTTRRFSRLAQVEALFRSRRQQLAQIRAVRSELPDSFVGRLAAHMAGDPEAELDRRTADALVTALAAVGARTLAGGPAGAKTTNTAATERKQALITEWIAWAKPLPSCPTHSAEARRIAGHFYPDKPEKKLQTVRKSLPKREAW